MSLIHGKRISGEEVERLVSREFDAELFASLCNAVAWAIAGRRCSSLPSFTERVNVKDQGIDAEWETTFPDDQDSSCRLLGPGWNVHQYKQRDVIAQGSSHTFSGIKSGCRRAVWELHRRTGRRPDRYTLFTNVDLSHHQKEKLKEEILVDYDRPQEAGVGIIGAAELATILNDLAHLRSAFFATADFCTWAAQWKRHQQQLVSCASVELVGRTDVLAHLRSCVDDPAIKCIVVSGPQGIGKTRIALHASDHRPYETVVALDSSMSASQLLALDTPNAETVVIVEDPGRKCADELADFVLTHPRLKLLITLPTAENAPAPNFGRDNRIRIVPLHPLSNSESHELLQKAEDSLDFGIRSWIAEQAGGIPGILLTAARLGPDLRRTARSFAEEVAAAIERKVCDQLGDRAIEILSRLSLMSHVGVRRDASGEIQLICDVFKGPDVNAVLNAVSKLEKAGLARSGGSFVQVCPPLLANRLATSALRGRFAHMLSLLERLPPRGQVRLMERLRLLTGEEVTRFWNELFSESGLFSGFPQVLANVRLLHHIAGAVPVRTAKLIEDGLKGLSWEDRLRIRDGERRELMWALEQLLFRKKTSAMALACLSLLAEAENETWGNNATGVFCEAFSYQHPQLPLPLCERLFLLEQLLSPGNPRTLRLLGIQAAAAGLDGRPSYTLRQSDGPEPFDCCPGMTWGELFQYTERLVEILLTHSCSDEIGLAEAARKALPWALAHGATHLPPERGFRPLETAVEWLLNGRVPISASDLMDALSWIQERWREEAKRLTKREDVGLASCIERLTILMDRIERAQFPMRLRLWTGGWSRRDPKGTQLAELAQEAIEVPVGLSDDLITWLCSEEAKRGPQFFYCLGTADLDKRWMARLKLLATDRKAAPHFAAYCQGIGRHDTPFAIASLGYPGESTKLAPEAIVLAVASLRGDSSGVAHLESLLLEKQVEHQFVASALFNSTWAEALGEEEYWRLMNALAGENREHAALVAEHLGFWGDSQRQIEGRLADLAWECLEAADQVVGNTGDNFDHLAAHLSRLDPERGFSVFERLLAQASSREGWIPLSIVGSREFWESLRQVDCHRALRIAIQAAHADPIARIYITGGLRDVLEQQEDADALISLAAESEAWAEIVCDCLTTSRPGFWFVALAILDKNSQSESTKALLEQRVLQVGQGIFGPWSHHLMNCRVEVVRVLADAGTPTTARNWLEGFESRLADQAEQQRIAEYDEEANGLRRPLEATVLPVREWASETLRRHMNEDNLR